MTTLRELTDSILAELHSYTGVQETYTWLSADLDATSTTVAVADSSTVFRGITEIEDELVFVDAADANTLALAPFGRGYRGSTAATHTANTQVLYDPAFPRAEVKKRINKVVTALYPTLYQVKTTEYTADGVTVNLDLPDDADKVLSISYQIPGEVTGFWIPVTSWRRDPTNQNAKTIFLLGPITPGATIRVTYQAPFGTLSANEDTLASAGLPESCADLIEYAVTAHMVRFLDPARLQVSSVENVSRAQVVQAGDAGKVANQLYAMYGQRLQEERRKLIDLTPPSINYQD